MVKVGLDSAEKKFRQAAFFLDKMVKQERNAFGDREPFDFYLSAFLEAGYALHNRLHFALNQAHGLPQGDKTFTGWRDKWRASRQQSEQDLIKFLIDDRGSEVHEDGSERVASIEKIQIAVGTHYSDDSGTVYAMGSPGIVLGLPPSESGVTIEKPTYVFSIGGSTRKVVEACEEYLGLLKVMIDQFKIDYS